jgi:hypothetical protein
MLVPPSPMAAGKAELDWRRDCIGETREGTNADGATARARQERRQNHMRIRVRQRDWPRRTRSTDTGSGPSRETGARPATYFDGGGTNEDSWQQGQSFNAYGGQQYGVAATGIMGCSSGGRQSGLWLRVDSSHGAADQQHRFPAGSTERQWWSAAAAAAKQQHRAMW